MKRIKITHLIMAMALFVIAFTSPASAAKPMPATPVGNDVSYPQCNRTLHKTSAFCIVGINGGKATTLNPCLSSELIWASQTKGSTSQPKVQVYVNTANPGEVIGLVTTWPTSSTAENPYAGPCNGTNTLSCSWQYGWNRAIDQVNNMFIPAAIKAGINAEPSAYRWWLDVETMNTWQSADNGGLARNAAALEGMTAYFTSRGITRIGIYSTGYQWGIIAADGVSSSSNLNGLDSWLAGASNLSSAQIYCNKPALTTGGIVTLTQYIASNLDYDYSCVQ